MERPPIESPTCYALAPHLGGGLKKPLLEVYFESVKTRSYTRIKWKESDVPHMGYALASPSGDQTFSRFQKGHSLRYILKVSKHVSRQQHNGKIVNWTTYGYALVSPFGE